MRKRRYSTPNEYIVALQRAIESHCKGKVVPEAVARECPHHAGLLNVDLAKNNVIADKKGGA